MAQSLYLNNGNIFDVVDTIFISTTTDSTISGGGDGFSIAPGEPQISYINGLDYITPDMQPHRVLMPPYGIIPNLRQEGDKSILFQYIEMINQNGAFVWGDAFNGGLYVYRDTTTTYAAALFCGYGESVSNSSRCIFYIHNFLQLQGLTETQFKWLTIVHATVVDTYFFLIPALQVIDGEPASIESSGEALHNNPLDPDQITGVSYNLFSTLISMPGYGWNDATFTVNPMGSDSSYLSPQYILLVYDSSNTRYIITTQNIGVRGYVDDPNYNQQGSWWGGDDNIVTVDPNKGITNTTGGGYGTPSKQSDDIGLPDDNQFSIDATNCGFVTIFNPTAAQMLSFNQWLFASFTESWWDTLKKILQDPLDFVISAGIIKYKPTVKLANQEIKFNGIGTEVFADTVRQWEKIDLGSVSMSEQFQTYLDYSGYSDVKIYLPFCGIQSLDINDVQNSILHLVYYIDNLTGSCIAHLNVNRADRGQTDDSHINSVLYKFTGNAMQTLPLTAKDYATMIGAVMNLATSTVAAVSTGGVGALGLANSVSNSADKLRPSIQRSGNLGSNYGMMDCLTPYLILERPIRSIPAEYGSYVGYPSASTIRIGACKGYTKGRPATNWASNIHATDREKEEIKELIEGGIYI